MSEKFSKYHYYKIDNVITVNALNQLMSVYNSQFILIGGWKSHHLFSKMKLLEMFPCISISDFQGLFIISTVGYLVNHLQTIVNTSSTILSKLCYSLLKYCNNKPIFDNVLCILPRTILHNEHCVKFTSMQSLKYIKLVSIAAVHFHGF